MARFAPPAAHPLGLAADRTLAAAGSPAGPADRPGRVVVAGLVGLALGCDGGRA